MGRTATLLIIEDEPETVAVLKAYFQAQGYRVLAAASGEEALAMAREHTPDVILLDIRLPDIDGFEVFRRLRTHRRTEGIPVIFLTERRGRQDRLAGLELGAYDYIPKPFSLQELRARVQNILRRSQAGPAFDFLTGLPGLPLILEHLEEQLGRTGWVAWLIGLEGLEAFGEHYGFVARDDAIRAVGLLLAGVNHEGGEGLFLGHLGEGLFLMTGEARQAVALGEKALPPAERAALLLPAPGARGGSGGPPGPADRRRPSHGRRGAFRRPGGRPRGVAPPAGAGGGGAPLREPALRRSTSCGSSACGSAGRP